MELKSIKITGMHKVDSKTYNFDNNLTYMVGPNGSGKSTVLEAIQLALLGYIPGYSKTNDAVMKHSNGNILSVEAKLADDNNIIRIVRTWIKSGSSTKCDISIEPDGYDIKSILSELELPIFNFTEFKDMTANKLKEWFISFLPNSDASCSVEELRSAVAAKSVNCEDYVNDTLDSLSKLCGNDLTLDAVKSINSRLKEDESFIKGQIKQLQGTIDSLIHYDDEVIIDEEEVKIEIEDLSKKKSEYIEWAARADQFKECTRKLDELKSVINVDDAKNEIIVLDKNVIDITAELEDAKSELDVATKQWSDLALEHAKYASISSDTCPYTKKQCAEISSILDEYSAKLKECEEASHEVGLNMSDIKLSITKLTNDIEEAKRRRSDISNKLDRIALLESQMPDNPGQFDNEFNVQDIDSKINELNTQLIHIAANKKYDELTNKVTKEKFKLELQLEVLKEWIKLTGPNGLQTSLTNKPFESLSDDMDKYLSEMFANDLIKSKFNLSEKANSFSFGIIRDSKYVEFDCLSSGEKCLYTLAMMMCLIERSDSSLKLILIDDMLDHLDETTAARFFDTLNTKDNIQFIFAGVKECNVPEICMEV